MGAVELHSYNYDDYKSIDATLTVSPVSPPLI